LRAIDLGREWRIIPRDLEAFLATHETCTPPSSTAGPGEPPPQRRPGAARQNGSSRTP
jgi:hypothetical protein